MANTSSLEAKANHSVRLAYPSCEVNETVEELDATCIGPAGRQIFPSEPFASQAVLVVRGECGKWSACQKRKRHGGGGVPEYLGIAHDTRTGNRDIAASMYALVSTHSSDAEHVSLSTA